ncbi:MAG: efflux RND transporter permease subunit [Bacteroidales bacterium]
MPEHHYYRIFHKPIIFVLLMILLAGVYSYHRMQTSLFPDVVFPKITVIADNGEQPVDKMMVTVTKPLEIAIKRVNGIQTVRSSTNRGSCTIEAFFTWNIDIQDTKTHLESRIAEIKNQLPPTVNIVVEAMGQSIYPVIGYTLESNSYGQVELKKEALYFVRPQFSMIPGVSNVVVRGGRTKEFVISPSQDKMIALGITPSQIINALGNTNFVESNGLLSDYHRLYLSLTDSRIKTIDELKQIVIRNDGHRVIRLSDIAGVDIEEQQEFIRINANGRDAVIVDLIKQKEVNLLDFAADVKQKAKEIQKQLPPGIILKPYYDQSAFVSKSIDSVLECIYEGLILAILVVILFLRSFRSSVNVIFIIPVTLALTFTALYLFGITLNIMSLGAIAASIGLIIDDAIVVIEQIHRTHEEQPDKDKHAVVKETIKMLFPAMIGSSLSTIVIFFPFVLMSGVAGSFFKELTLTMEITLVCSFLSTWLGLPALHLLLGYKPHKKYSFLTRKAVTEEKSRLSWLIWFFDKPVFAFVFILALGISSVLLINHLNTGFLPVLDEGSIVLDYLSPPGTSLDASDAILREVDTVVMRHPDVLTYMRRTGTNMASSISMASGVIPPNEGDYLIQLKASTHKKTEEVISELRQQVASKEPALNIEFGQRIADLLGDLIGRPQPVEIKIFGDDLNRLHDLAYKTKALLLKVKGVADVQSGIIVDGPTITIVPDPSKLAIFNLTPADFQTQVKAANEGVDVGEVQEGEQMLRILMRITNFRENNLQKIKKQLIFTPDGHYHPLDFFADVKLSAGDPDITREDLKSNVVVTARLDNRDLGSAITEIKQVINKKLLLPSGFYILYGGTYAEQQSSFRELLLILISAILLVFAVLLFLFKNLRITFLVIFISVAGIGGSIWALFLSGIQLNVASYTGIIMIVGIIAENAIFTVNQFMTTLNKTGNVDQSIAYAISLRIRPKLMTAIGATLALSPLALGLGIGAQMQQPLAIAVIGGFIVAMPLLLFVFPSFLRLLYKK